MTYDGGPIVSVDPPDPNAIVYNETDYPYKLAGGVAVIEPPPVAVSEVHPVTSGLDVDITCTDASIDPYENIGMHKPGDTMTLSPGNYGDIKLGTWYPMGGMYKVVEAMHELALSLGVEFVFNTEVEKMEFKTTIDDVAAWAGISPEKCRAVINRFINQRRVELYPDRVVVRNINDFIRFVKSRRRRQD